MIDYIIPWRTDKNLGKAYNEALKFTKKKWVCFLDRDAMFTTAFYGKQIEEIVTKYPKIGLFTCHTNRVNCRWQIPVGIDKETNDMAYHFKNGAEIEEQNYGLVEDKTTGAPMSGVMMVVNKEVWSRVGGFREDKMLGIDNDFHMKLRRQLGKLYLMKGVYVYHWYRNNNKQSNQHLK